MGLGCGIKVLGLRLTEANLLLSIHKLKQDASRGTQGFRKQSRGLGLFVREREGGFYSQGRDYETLLRASRAGVA